MVAFLRRSQAGDVLAFVVNATPVVRYNYRLGVPNEGFYREIINTDGETYGGSNVGNFGGLHSEAIEWQAREHSIVINLPPLAVVAFKWEKPAAAAGPMVAEKDEAEPGDKTGK